MSESFLEGLKQLGRVALFAVLPLLISGLQAGVVDFRAIAIAAAISVLSGIDRLLHEMNKDKPVAERNDGLLGEKGLAGF